jgi:membrane protease subunit HflK
MKDIIPKLGPKYIIDADQKNFLPLLNIGKQIGIEK